MRYRVVYRPPSKSIFDLRCNADSWDVEKEIRPGKWVDATGEYYSVERHAEKAMREEIRKEQMCSLGTRVVLEAQT